MSSGRTRPYNFYYNVSGVDSERLLMDYGMEGSFLARPSTSNPGDYTLSVKRNGRVTHIKIQKTGDFLDLYGGEKFATLSELVQYYVENSDQLREKNGDVIPLKGPLSVSTAQLESCTSFDVGEDVTSDNLAAVTERWFHGSLSGKEAEDLLKAHGRNGSFLVRESQSTPGQYALSVRTEDKITHIMIHRRDGRFDVGGGDSFETLSDLIDHYRKNPMVDTSAVVLHLKNPFNATRINAAGLEDRVRQLQNDNLGKGGFWDEFEQLQLLDVKFLYSRKEGQRAENRPKNRYKNILPFDHTRIVLKDADPAILGSDYINANLVEVLSAYEEFSGLERRYISTQGCLPNTVDDFWRLVWQENSRLLVMTTREVERGRRKCERYWPELGESRQFGLHKEICVENMDEDTTGDYTVRTFKMRKAGCSEERVVWHWHFLAWPDHGCPADPGTVLNFLEHVDHCIDSSCPPDAGPTIVHCSAGIGRTGTFIVIDLILNQIKRLGLHCTIDIQRTVQMVREQRSGLVQTDQQYQFLYQAVTYYIDTVKKHLDSAHRMQAGREYTNIRYTAEGTGQLRSGPATPTTPHSPGVPLRSTPENGQGVMTPFPLDPPPLPKRAPKNAQNHRN